MGKVYSAGSGITYNKDAFDGIITKNDDDIKRLEELQARLSEDITTIKANWTDEESRITERDNDFKVIEERVASINTNFKGINSMLKDKNEGFFNTKY